MTLLLAVGASASARATAIHVSLCAATPEAAIARYLTDGMETEGPAGGYRVVGLRVDVLRQQRYALLADCAHPTAPLRFVGLPGASGTAVLARPAGVRIGEQVSVVQRSEESRMRFSGVAEDSGGAGEVVRVRLERLGEDDSQAATELRCRVIGRGIVEVVR